MDSRAWSSLLAPITAAVWPILAKQPRHRAGAVQLQDSSWAERACACSLPVPLWPTGLQRTWQQGLHSAEQQIAEHPEVQGATLVWQNVLRQERRAACCSRQSRLQSISTGDNRALIVWDNKSHRECANAIGWAHLTYAQQNDIWQLVTSLPQMLTGFVLVQCVVQIQYSIPLWWGAVSASSTPPPPSTKDSRCCEGF